MGAPADAPPGLAGTAIQCSQRPPADRAADVADGTAHDPQSTCAPCSPSPSPGPRTQHGSLPAARPMRSGWATLSASARAVSAERPTGEGSGSPPRNEGGAGTVAACMHVDGRGRSPAPLHRCRPPPSSRTGEEEEAAGRDQQQHPSPSACKADPPAASQQQDVVGRVEDAALLDLRRLPAGGAAPARRRPPFAGDAGACPAERTAADVLRDCVVSTTGCTHSLPRDCGGGTPPEPRARSGRPRRQGQPLPGSAKRLPHGSALVTVTSDAGCASSARSRREAAGRAVAAAAPPEALVAAFERALAGIERYRVAEGAASGVDYGAHHLAAQRGEEEEGGGGGGGLPRQGAVGGGQHAQQGPLEDRTFITGVGITDVLGQQAAAEPVSHAELGPREVEDPTEQLAAALGLDVRLLAHRAVGGAPAGDASRALANLRFALDHPLVDPTAVLEPERHHMALTAAARAKRRAPRARSPTAAALPSFQPPPTTREEKVAAVEVVLEQVRGRMQALQGSMLQGLQEQAQRCWTLAAEASAVDRPIEQGI